MILVITSSFDKTIDFIEDKHDFDGFFRFNIDKFSEYKVSYDSVGFEIINPGNKKITESHCQSIYYRKPTPEKISESIINPIYQSHIYREVFTFCEGISESFQGTCLSKPSILRVADNKLYQLKLAKEVGFNIIEPLISNDISKVINSLNNPIVKPLSSGLIEAGNTKEFVQTNIVDLSKKTENLKYSPCYFQNYKPKDYEVRITIINDKVHAVRIDSKDKIDWRKKDNHVSYTKISIPEEIELKCSGLMLLLNLKFGCFDFIVNDGEWFFLEINANGQWAWLDIKLGLGISSDILDYLKK